MSEQVSSDKDPDKPEVKMDGDKDRAGLDKQDSVDASSQLSAAFTEDSLNSGSDKDTRSARTGEEDSGGRLRVPGESEETSDTETDLATTAVNGWKFWVPASAVNFYAVPLQYQVLYMSCAGLVWSTYLSYSSNK